jgi:hypothetical protein
LPNIDALDLKLLENMNLLFAKCLRHVASSSSVFESTKLFISTTCPTLLHRVAFRIYSLRNWSCVVHLARMHQFTFFLILISYVILRASTLLIIWMLGTYVLWCMIIHKVQLSYQSLVLIMTIPLAILITRAKQSYNLIFFYFLPYP